MEKMKDNSNGIDVHDLQDMCRGFLSKCNIKISGNITRFGQDLLKNKSNYEIIKDQETRVIKNLFESYSVSFNIHQKAGLKPSRQLLSQLERTYLNGKTCLIVTRV